MKMRKKNSRALVNIIFDLLLIHLDTALAFTYLLFKIKKRKVVVPLVLFTIADTHEYRFKIRSKLVDNSHLTKVKILQGLLFTLNMQFQVFDHILCHNM